MKYFPHILLCLFTFFTIYHVIALYGAISLGLGTSKIAWNVFFLGWNFYFAHDIYQRHFA